MALHINDDNYKLIKASCGINPFMNINYYLNNKYVTKSIDSNGNLNDLLTKR